MVYVYVAVGGFFGAIARYGIGSFFAANGTDAFPFGTFIVNLAGAFVMGLFLTLTREYLTISKELRIGISTGFVGAFTTFSTFTLETVLLIEAGRIFTGVAYLAASLLLGLTFLWFGVLLGKGIAAARKEGA